MSYMGCSATTNLTTGRITVVCFIEHSMVDLQVPFGKDFDGRR